MRYAVAVAETLHFGRASEQVRVSQPSLSRQVRALEREVGTALFHRTSRQVELTAAGSAFMPVARRALDLLDVAAEQARQSARGQLGQLRLGFVATAAIDVLPRVLELHRAHRPRVSVSLTECTSTDQIQALLAEDLDVGIGRDVPVVEGLRVEMIRDEPIYVAVADSHPLAGREQVRLEDLAGQAFVRLPPRGARHIDRLLAQVPGAVPLGGPDRTVVQEANQYMTLLALVAAGMGIALEPEPVTGLRQDGVRHLRLEHAEAHSALTLASRTNDTSPIVRDFRMLLLGSELADVAACPWPPPAP